MDILSELNDFKTQYEAASQLLEEANVDLTSKALQISSKAAEIEGLKAQIASYLEELQIRDAEAKELNGKIAGLEASQKSAQLQAVELVAAQGIAPVSVDASHLRGELSKEEALNTYASIADSMERGRFYLKHKDLLLG